MVTAAPAKASAPKRRIDPMVIVLGIDPGTAHTGYGVVLARGRTLAALDGGVLHTRLDDALERRLAHIHEQVRELIERHEPDAMAGEGPHFRQKTPGGVA